MHQQRDVHECYVDNPNHCVDGYDDEESSSLGYSSCRRAVLVFCDDYRRFASDASKRGNAMNAKRIVTGVVNVG